MEPSGKFGIHFSENGEVAIVATQVSANSRNVEDKSQIYLEGIKELLSRSGDVIDLAKGASVEVESQRHKVLAGRQILTALSEGRSPARKEISNTISELEKEIQVKTNELERLLENEAALQLQIDTITQPRNAGG